MPSAVYRWAPVLAWAGVIFVLSSIPDLGTGLGGWDLGLRKIAHAAEYAVLGFLLLRAVGRAELALALGIAYAVSDEIHQHFVSGRRARRSTSRSTPSASRSASTSDDDGSAGTATSISGVDGPKDVGDRQLDALLERLDRLTDEVQGLNRRLDSGENLAPIVRELALLNDSLQALAYASLGQQGPQIRRRRAG